MIELIILPFGPMTSPILSTGTLIVVMRGAYGLISSGSSIASAITSRMVMPGVLGLRQRTGQHLRRDAVELGVQLQRGDEVLGACDLEVHVAERVLGAEDVGQRDEATLGAAVVQLDVVGDQTHRDAGDRRLQRHTGVQQRQRRRAHRAHRRRTVGAQRLRHLTDRVRELLDARQHRHQRPLGQRAVADLAALGRTDPAGLTGRVRREVVVVHVALAGLGSQRVDLLRHLDHVQRGDTHDLGLAALEQRAAVRPRDHGRPRPTARGCR